MIDGELTEKERWSRRAKLIRQMCETGLAEDVHKNCKDCEHYNPEGSWKDRDFCDIDSQLDRDKIGCWLSYDNVKEV